MTIMRNPTTEFDAAKASKILIEASRRKHEALAAGETWNGNREHGFEVRTRSALTRDAGSTYNEAYSLFHDMNKVVTALFRK